MFDLDRWEDDLASGEFTPTAGYLNIGENRMCCLGVLVNQSATWEVDTVFADGTSVYRSGSMRAAPDANVCQFLDESFDALAMNASARLPGNPSVVSILMSVNDNAVQDGDTDYTEVLDLIRKGRKV